MHSSADISEDEFMGDFPQDREMSDHSEEEEEEEEGKSPSPSSSAAAAAPSLPLGRLATPPPPPLSVMDSAVALFSIDLETPATTTMPVGKESLADLLGDAGKV